jgi:hypothetical protein
MRFLFLAISFVLVLTNCSNKKEMEVKHISKPLFEKQISLQADSVHISEAIYPYGWQLSGDQLIVLSVQNRDYFLYTFSVPDFKLLYKYGQYGQGPGEFIAVNWMNAIRENQLGLYDIPRLSMYLYDLKSDTLNICKIYKFNKWDKNLCKPYTFIQQLTDSIFLLKADMKNETAIEVVNINSGAILQTFQNLIIRKPGITYSAYYFEMASNAKKLVLAYSRIDRLEIFQYDTKMNPSLIIGSDEDQGDKEELNDYIRYYTRVLCDEKYIYCLYQGKVEKELKKSYIEIYTFDGSPVIQIELDRYIKSILLDKTKNCIYGYNPGDGFDHIFIYRFLFDEELSVN